MIEASPDDTNQLTTGVNHPQIRPLVITPVLLLHAPLHLCHVVGGQEQMLEMTTSSHGTSGDEIIQGKRVKGPESTPWTFHGLIDRFSRRVNTVGIVVSGSHVLDIVLRLELLEALHTCVVDILGIGNELRRRRSIGGRHFVWRTG